MNERPRRREPSPDATGGVPAAPHPHEGARLEALHALGVLDGPPGAQFDRLTALATSLFDVPTALISLVDEGRSWFLSRAGFGATEAPRDAAFCAHALHENVALVVEDASLDDRFAANPFVVGPPFLRFYAGVVLRDRDALPLGTLCLMSPRPRAFTDADRRLLVRLCELVAGELLPTERPPGDPAGQDAVRCATDPSSGVGLAGTPATRFTRTVNERLHRAPPRRVVAAVVTLPGLERINEIFGTDVGDEVLAEVVTRLTRVAAGYRDGAVARLGGRRLGLCGIDDARDDARIDGADALAAACETALHPPFVIGDRMLSPDLHAGVAVGQADRADAGALLERCRTALAGIGTERGVRVARHDEDGQRTMHRRMRIAAELGGAIAHDALHLVCQPKFGCESRALEGFECLLRWHHAELGHVAPPEIVEAAGDVNLALALDRWVVDRALRQVARWRSAGLRAGVVSINVTGATLVAHGFADWLSERLRHHGLPAPAIELEVLESSVFDDLEVVVAALGRLRGLGVGLSLDDFGTGYSSLSYLRRLPVSVLKIDRSFVSRLEREPSDVALCVGILSIARSLGLSVVAEGVENARQLDILRSHRCDTAQGYHLGRPMPLEAATRLLEADGAPPARRAA